MTTGEVRSLREAPNAWTPLTIAALFIPRIICIIVRFSTPRPNPAPILHQSLVNNEPSRLDSLACRFYSWDDHHDVFLNLSSDRPVRSPQRGTMTDSPLFFRRFASVGHEQAERP